jgi:CheY-like chemotaxis protein
MRERNYNFENLNVLVVDDNKHMLSLVETILHAMRVKNVRCVGDAAEAFAEMRTCRSDIVITDWAMQPLDGLDFVRLVRKGEDSPDPYVPIILLTGHTEMHRVREARDSGVNEVLAKPVSIQGLHRRIVSIVMHPRHFIRTHAYFGPDRRRADRPFDGPERRADYRRKAQEAAPGLSAEEIDRLFES